MLRVYVDPYNRERPHRALEHRAPNRTTDEKVRPAGEIHRCDRLGGHLDSAGVRLLFRLADDWRTRRQRLRSSFPTASSWLKVLEVVGIEQAVTLDRLRLDVSPEEAVP